MRAHLALDPKRTALLLVDLQEEQRVVPEYSVAGFASVLANAQSLLQAARNRNLSAIFAAYKRDFTKVPPRPLEQIGVDGKAAFSDASSPLTEICGEVAPRAGEAVLMKNDASAFCEGDLEPILRRTAIEWLILCGVWTEACVAATVRDAIDRGFRVLLVKDACGSGTVAMHQTGILNLANRLYGGAVASTAVAIRLIEGETAEVWVPERPVPLLFEYRDAEALFDSL
jgi:nicotinamidase-related amidase